MPLCRPLHGPFPGSQKARPVCVLIVMMEASNLTARRFGAV